MPEKILVVLTGAGISAESGLQTFRDHDGLWNGYRIDEVATPEAWQRDSARVLDFYTMRRKGVNAAQPNAAHLALVRLESSFKVHIITQNVDNLHERAGSKDVLHLHGLITRARSTRDPSLTYPIDGDELGIGEVCELGSQLRPDIVWFGEPVPLMDVAIPMMKSANIVLVVGTSLAVYPAAGLLDFVSPGTPVHIIDPAIPPVEHLSGVVPHRARATEGVPPLVEKLLHPESLA